MGTTRKTWKVELLLSERDGQTHAEARLHSGLGHDLTATGDARLSPEDPVDVPAIGDELAAARALTGLGRLLLESADADVHDLLRELPRV
jgi:hypothetical protein